MTAEEREYLLIKYAVQAGTQLTDLLRRAEHHIGALHAALEETGGGGAATAEQRLERLDYLVTRASTIFDDDRERIAQAAIDHDIIDVMGNGMGLPVPVDLVAGAAEGGAR